MPGDREPYTALDKLAPHVLELALKHQQPPGALYVSQNDALFISARASVASLAVTFSARVRRPDGLVREMVETLAPAADRTNATASFQLGEGWLLALSVTVTGATVRRGQCYVSARLRASSAASPVESLLVWQGYVESSQPSGWPVTPAHGPLDGRGATRIILGTNPAAGAEVLETVPTGARWRVIGVLLTLVCDATVATRVCILILDDATTVGAATISPAAPTASQTGTFIFQEGTGFIALGTTFGVGALPRELVLRAGDRIVTSTSGIAAGDNYAAPQYSVEEWLAD